MSGSNGVALALIAVNGLEILSALGIAFYLAAKRGWRIMTPVYKPPQDSAAPVPDSGAGAVVPGIGRRSA